MNLNGDEKRIQRLFREMSRDDQRRAPQFAEVMSAANSGMTRPQNRAPSVRFALTAAILGTVLLIAMAIVVSRSSSQREPTSDRQATAPPAQPEAASVVESSSPNLAAPGPAPRKPVVKRARHRRTSDQTAIAMKSLFAWRSPTASLLRAPDDELLKSLPRLGESLQTIRNYSPDQFN